MFSKFINAENIDQMFMGEPKKLRIGQNIFDGWQVFRVKRGLHSGEPCIPDVPPHLVTTIKSLRNELAIMTRKYQEAKRMNITREQGDLFRQKVKDEFKFVGDAKNKIFGNSYNDYGGGGWTTPFSSRWGGGMLPNQSSDSNE
jgi:hypothetical protein